MKKYIIESGSMRGKTVMASTWHDAVRKVLEVGAAKELGSLIRIKQEKKRAIYVDAITLLKEFNLLDKYTATEKSVAIDREISLSHYPRR